MHAAAPSPPPPPMQRMAIVVVGDFDDPQRVLQLIHATLGTGGAAAAA